MYSVSLATGKTICQDNMSAITGHHYKAQISSTLAVANSLVFGGMSPYGPIPKCLL